MNKFKDRAIKLIPYILFFILIFVLCHSSTIMADDVRYGLRSMFNNILPNEKITSLYQSLESTYYDYMTWNSRFMTNIILSTVLRFDRDLWMFLNPLIITMSFYNVSSIFKKEQNRKTIIIEFALLFSLFQLADIVFDESVIWITGSLFYFWSIYASTHILKRMLVDKKTKLWDYLLAVFFGLQAGSAIENLAISMSVILVLLFVYSYFYLRNKEFITKERIVILISVISANIVSFISPAVRIRSGEQSYGLMYNIIRGIVTFFDFQFTKSTLIPLFLVVLLALYIRKYSKLLSNISLIMSIPYGVIMVGYVINYNFFHALVESNGLLLYIFDGYYLWQYVNGGIYLKLAALAAWALFTIPIILEILIIIFKEKNVKLSTFCLLATLPNLALIPLGIGSIRASFFAQFFMMCAIAALLYSFDSKHTEKLAFVFLLSSLVVLGIRTPTLYKNIRVGQERTAVINMYREDPDAYGGLDYPKYALSVHGNFEDYNTWENVEYRKYYLRYEGNKYVKFVDYDEYFADK